MRTRGSLNRGTIKKWKQRDNDSDRQRKEEKEVEKKMKESVCDRWAEFRFS